MASLAALASSGELKSTNPNLGNELRDSQSNSTSCSTTYRYLTAIPSETPPALLQLHRDQDCVTCQTAVATHNRWEPHCEFASTGQLIFFSCESIDCHGFVGRKELIEK